MSETATENAAPTTRQMRTWLRANEQDTGIKVGARGFLSKDAENAYRTAHSLPTIAQA